MDYPFHIINSGIKTKTIALPKRAMAKEHLYVSTRIKFTISTLIATLWFLTSSYISIPWIKDLGEIIGIPLSIIIIMFIALIPGFLNLHLLTSVIMDKPKPLPKRVHLPPVSILIAAYNEEDVISETIHSILQQNYPNDVEIVIADDGSTDHTVYIVRSLNLKNLKLVCAEHGGKAHALNEGLEHTSNNLVVTIDADTFLYKEALRRIVMRLITDPPNTAAVAGSVLVKNSRSTFLAKLQEWDYFVAIASVKRQQSLYQGTLVAQGAFSIFKKTQLKRVAGWPDVIGEDIVLTWALLKRGYRIGFEPTAIGFTTAPTTIKRFARQRIRWARGMIEGIKRHGNLVWRMPSIPSFFVAVDFLFPLLDFAYSVFFIPGLVLAFMGKFYIAGPTTLFVLPINLIIIYVMYRKGKKVFDELGLIVRRNRLGIIVYILFYQMIMSPVCLFGYTKELFKLPRKW